MSPSLRLSVSPSLRLSVSRLPREFTLSAEGEPTIRAQAERGYWNSECYVRIPAAEFATMKRGVPYKLSATDQTAEYRWQVGDDVKITREE